VRTDYQNIQGRGLSDIGVAEQLLFPIGRKGPGAWEEVAGPPGSSMDRRPPVKVLSGADSPSHTSLLTSFLVHVPRGNNRRESVSVAP